MGEVCCALPVVVALLLEVVAVAVLCARGGRCLHARTLARCAGCTCACAKHLCLRQAPYP